MSNGDVQARRCAELVEVRRTEPVEVFCEPLRVKLPLPTRLQTVIYDFEKTDIYTKKYLLCFTLGKHL